MSEHSYETLIVEVRGPVARLVFNRPDKLNSFDRVLRGEMMDAVAALNRDPSIRIVVLSGAGRAFCAGADLSDSSGGDAANVGAATEHMLKTEYKPSLMGIAESPKLWIAAVGGPSVEFLSA